MELTVKQLAEFYEGVDYWPGRHSSRPREAHFPKELGRWLSDLTVDQLRVYKQDNEKAPKLSLPLAPNTVEHVRPLLLHESLFHLYKAFYNYLAARILYDGGMIAWMEITLYYVKFYLARSLTTLVGQQSYQVASDQDWFSVAMFEALTGKEIEVDRAHCLDENIRQKRYKYRVVLDVHPETHSGVLVVDLKGVSSHRDVWASYESLSVESLGLHSLSDHPENEGPDYLSKLRNMENYSFEGYPQLDFNLYLQGFKEWFQRDHIRQDSNRLYDWVSGEVLMAFSEQLGLLRSLGIPSLPIEDEKFGYMIDYCLPESQAKQKLLHLCAEGFPTRHLSSADGDLLCDDQGRLL